MCYFLTDSWFKHFLSTKFWCLFMCSLTSCNQSILLRCFLRSFLSSKCFYGYWVVIQSNIGAFKPSFLRNLACCGTKLILTAILYFLFVVGQVTIVYPEFSTIIVRLGTWLNQGALYSVLSFLFISIWKLLFLIVLTTLVLLWFLLMRDEFCTCLPTQFRCVR